MLLTVVLSMCIGVGGWGCPSSWIISQSTFASLALWKSAPSSASAADAATVWRTVHIDCMDPLRKIGWLLTGCLPRKNVQRFNFVPLVQSGKRHPNVHCVSYRMHKIVSWRQGTFGYSLRNLSFALTFSL